MAKLYDDFYCCKLILHHPLKDLDHIPRDSEGNILSWKQAYHICKKTHFHPINPMRIDGKDEKYDVGHMKD